MAGGGRRGVRCPAPVGGPALRCARLPLYHTRGAPNEGVFKAVLRIGGLDLHVLVDTCSSDLLVLGHPCGSVPVAEVGSWPLCRGQDTGERAIVSYASQTNHVTWVWDAIQFEADDGEDCPPYPLRFGVITANVSHVVQGGILPGRSILGLYSQQPGHCCPCADEGLLERSDDSFVSQLFGKHGLFPAAVYSMCFDLDGDGGELLLGAVHDGIRAWVPLLGRREYPPLEYSPQCMVPLCRASVVGLDGAVLFDLPLRLARLDTGNTWMSLPAAIFRRYGHLGRAPRVAGLRLHLPRRLVLYFPRFLFSGPTAVANATGFGGLAEDGSLDDDVMVIGNSVMKGMIVACDLATARLGFGGVSTAVGDAEFSWSLPGPSLQMS